MTEAATITVRGVGRVTMPPDRCVITFSIASLNKDYVASTDELNRRVTELRDRMAAAGIPRNDLKTTHYNVKAEHEYLGEGHKRQFQFIGWKAEHEMRLEFAIDRELMNKALTAIASGDVKSEIKVGFEVSDRAGLRALVLEDATKTAARNADSIARAAGCTLGPPIKIDYSWAEIRFGTRQHEMRVGQVLSPDALRAPDIEPENVRGEDSVTVIYELKR